MEKINCGDIWLADLNPVKGAEQKGYRPVLIVSSTDFNAIPHKLAVIMAISKQYHGYPTHIPIETIGLDYQSYVMVQHIRSISTTRLTRKIAHIKNKRDLIKISEILNNILFEDSGNDF